jgi:hypothetical protein
MPTLQLEMQGQPVRLLSKPHILQPPQSLKSQACLISSPTCTDIFDIFDILFFNLNRVLTSNNAKGDHNRFFPAPGDLRL